jgi:glycosyltransferase involved in cell wall biosynthesis
MPNITPSNSSHVLLCGVGPTPIGNPERLYAPGLRVWGFARALVAAGCAVDLLEVRFGEAASGGAGTLRRLCPARQEEGERTVPPILPSRGSTSEVRDGILAETVSLPAGAPAELVARQLASASYDAVISTTDVMNHACACACGDLPLWCDYYGHPMAERQSMAAVYQSDEGLTGQWDYVIAPLLRADRLSGCSAAQRLAIIGEMGACGRLNRFMNEFDIVCSLPPVVPFPEYRATGRAFRGEAGGDEFVAPSLKVPQDAFAALWSGGFNTWADPDTLASGLTLAMQREPRIHFVIAGGAIAGHDDRTFARFRERMEASACGARCHFAGWVRPTEVPNYYLESDLAVSCEKNNLEGELGTRTRVLEWICARLPVITTNVCEFARDLSDRGLIDGVKAGDAEALADLLVTAARRSPEEVRSRAEKARRHVLESYTPERLFQPVCVWARRPERAPDLLGACERMERVPFAFPANPLSRRRAEEWRAVWGVAGEAGRTETPGRPKAGLEACCPLTNIFRRLLGRR